jgi:hypothetical protein
MNLKNTVVWEVIPYGLVQKHRFEQIYYLHLQDGRGK